ncbi:MAG: hypothetical protein ABFS39_05745 [Pseudomonadota bacterium]
MQVTTRSAIALMAILLTAITFTSGCSGSREDVRVTFCKNLTSALLDSPQALLWQGNENRFQRPEYVAVKVLFELPDEADGDAVCFYDYATVDENVMTQTQPLSAYSTLPYQMELNGELVAKSVLSDAIKSQQAILINNIVNRLLKRFDDVVDQLTNSTEDP